MPLPPCNPDDLALTIQTITPPPAEARLVMTARAVIGPRAASAADADAVMRGYRTVAIRARLLLYKRVVICPGLDRVVTPMCNNGAAESAGTFIGRGGRTPLARRFSGEKLVMHMRQSAHISSQKGQNKSSQKGQNKDD